MSGNVLIVDGAATNRITLKVRLSAACYHVIAARTLDEAVEIMRRAPPDIVVVGGAAGDVPAPVVCARLAAESSGTVPVIVVADGAERLRALRSGATATIDRPVDDHVLLARIRLLLRDGAPVSLPATTPSVPHLPYAIHPPHGGLAEAPAAFAGASGPVGQTAARGDTITLIAQEPAMAMAWQRALRGHIDVPVRISDPAQALAQAAAGAGADLYVVSADLSGHGDGLNLMAELKSRAGSRHAAFVAVIPRGERRMTATALDLGAGDVLPVDLAAAPEEAAFRLSLQLARKRDADGRRRMALRNQQLAWCDPLTDIPNRRYGLARLAELLQPVRNGGGDGAVAIAIDVDHFKQINDSFGHPAGDAVLRHVARRMQSALPPDGFLARMGGEEFLALLPFAQAGDGVAWADLLRAAVGDRPVPLPDSAGGGETRVTVSAGVASSSAAQSDLDVDRLLARADRALMAAKARGRDRAVLWDRLVAAA